MWEFRKAFYYSKNNLLFSFLTFSLKIDSDEVDESVEENDEDFNFMAFEEEVDQEEFRTDKGVKVTRKCLIFNILLSKDISKIDINSAISSRELIKICKHLPSKSAV